MDREDILLTLRTLPRVDIEEVTLNISGSAIESSILEGYSSCKELASGQHCEILVSNGLRNVFHICISFMALSEIKNSKTVRQMSLF